MVLINNLWILKNLLVKNEDTDKSTQNAKTDLNARCSHMAQGLFHEILLEWWVWSGGVKVLGKLPVAGRPTNLAYSRAGAYFAFSRCRWGLFGHFFSHLSLLFSFSLFLGDGPIYTEILSQRAVKSKTSNQPTSRMVTL